MDHDWHHYELLWLQNIFLINFGRFFANNLIWFDLLLSFSKYLFQKLPIYKIKRILYWIGTVFRPFPWYEESFLIEKIANHHQSMRIKRSRMHIEYRFWIIQFKAYSKKFSSSPTSLSSSSSSWLYIFIFLWMPP